MRKMRKVAWRCINCPRVFNPGHETIEDGEYFLIDTSKNLVCDKYANENYCIVEDKCYR